MEQKNKKSWKEKLILKKESYKFQKDEYEPQPLNWKKIIISLSVVITLVTTIVLVWGLAFGGFAYKEYKTTAQDFFKKVFQADDKNQAEENLKKFKYVDDDQFQGRLTEMVEHIYDESKMTYQGVDKEGNDISIDKYKYADHKRDFSSIRKISNEKYIFQFLDDESFKAEEPSLSTPWNNYLSRIVLIKITDNKISGIAFFATENARDNDTGSAQPYDYLGPAEKYWGAE